MNEVELNVMLLYKFNLIAILPNVFVDNIFKQNKKVLL
jgi:hypothetical protein